MLEPPRSSLVGVTGLECSKPLTTQTSANATVNGKRYPERIVRKIEPGMAND